MLLAMAIAMTAAPHLGQKLLRPPENKQRDEAAFSAFGAVISILGFVLAFSLVQANSKFHELEGKVAKEAAAFEGLDRVLLRIGKPGFADLRPVMANYG
jgi:hypothetical protein